MRRTITRIVGLAAAIAASLGVLACPVLAGGYVVSACSPSSSPGRWVPINTFSTALTTGNRCGGPAVGPTEASHQGALYSEDVLNSPGTIPDGARAGWTITAPAGATITAISYYRTLHAYNDSNMISGLFEADGTPLEQCKIPWPFVHGSSIHCDKVNNQAPATFTGLHTSALFFGMGCRLVEPQSSCLAGGTIHAASADLYSARVTLSESGAPTLGNVRGPLWDAGAVWGVVPVTFVASDPSGIQEQLVRSDSGQTLISAPQACDFGGTPPCPQQPAGTLNVDTTRVADGAHAFSLVVTDAAGNSQIAMSPSVLVDNNGPLPATLAATARGGGSRVIVLSWRNPPSPASPIARAMVQLCQATCPPATSIGASGAAQLTAPAAGVYSVRLWLIDANGRGGEHHAALATVNVPAAGDSVSGSGLVSRTRVAAVIKGRRLRVSGTIMRTGRVRVSWRSRIAKRSVGSGTRVVTIRRHKIALTFTLSARARRGTTRVTVRSGSRIVAQARARRG